MTATTFAIISSMNALLGDEPLAIFRSRPATKEGTCTPGFFSRPTVSRAGGEDVAPNREDVAAKMKTH